MGHAGRDQDRRRRRQPPCDAARHRRADRDRRDREDVEVEAQHGRSRRDHDDLRRRRGALVHAVGLAARARRGMDRARRAGRMAFHQPALAPDRRSDRGCKVSAGRKARELRRAGAARAQGGARRAGEGVGRDREAALQRLRGAHLRVRQRARLGAQRQTRAQRPTSPGRCARRPRSWSGCSIR